MNVMIAVDRGVTRVMVAVEKIDMEWAGILQRRGRDRETWFFIFFF